MRQNTENQLLKIFYEYPGKAFTVRELTRLTRIPRATVHKYLIKLKKQNLISRDNKAEKNLLFKTKKINYFTELIVSSGLVDELIDLFNPSCIILFGSVRKGDSISESDIDLFIESSVEKEISLESYQKKLGHKIQLFVEKDINKLQPHLLNNVVNGIKLYGSFKIK
jgi:predicted nucleotidyltransferase